MSMTIEIPDPIAQEVEKLCKGSGASPEQLVLTALSAHFPPISTELREEFEAWERASEEDAAHCDFPEASA